MTSSSYTADDFRTAFNVSRETMADLSHYLATLTKWQKTINLVGNETLKDPWRRHILDSAQLLPYIAEHVERIIDMGSGAGLPGIILAILLKNRSNLQIYLIESHSRKGAFLRQIIADLALPAKVITGRLEEGPLKLDLGGPVDLITARALAPLGDLLTYAQVFSGDKTQCLFLKGQHIEDELTQAAKYWNMESEFFPSLSSPSGCLVSIKEFSPC